MVLNASSVTENITTIARSVKEEHVSNSDASVEGRETGSKSGDKSGDGKVDGESFKEVGDVERHGTDTNLTTLKYFDEKNENRNQSPLDASNDPNSSTPLFEDEEGTHVSGILVIPDGGWRAWLVVLGSVFANIATFGFSNSQGVIQEYLVGRGGSLEHYGDSKVGWIFSLWLFLSYFGGVQVGPVFDAYGLKWLIIPGSILYVASVVFLSLCEKYYQFILGFSVLGGLSCSMIFNPSYTVIGHWFFKHRGVATGLTAAGGGIGGVFIPLMLNKLIPMIGFGWAIRVCALIFAALLLVSCLTLKSRHANRKVDWHEAMIDLRSLKEKKFSAAVASVFLFELAYFVPMLYLSSYARAQGLSRGYSNALLSYLSIGSTIGRALPGYIADKWGVFNVMIVTCFTTGLLCLTVWLPAGTTKAGLTVFAVLFGLFSGSTIGLTALVVAAISETRHYGKRYGTTYSIASIGALLGPPIAGTLTDHNYRGLIIFAGVVYISGSLALVASRWWAAKRTLLF